MVDELSFNVLVYLQVHQGFNRHVFRTLSRKLGRLRQSCWYASGHYRHVSTGMSTRDPVPCLRAL